MKRLNDILKMASITKAFVFVLFGCIFPINISFSYDISKVSCGSIGLRSSSYNDKTGTIVPWMTIENKDDSAELKQQKTKLQNALKEMNAFCDDLKKIDEDVEQGFFESDKSYNERFKKILNSNPIMKAKYNELSKTLINAVNETNTQRHKDEYPVDFMTTQEIKDKKNALEQSMNDYNKKAQQLNSQCPRNGNTSYSRYWPSEVAVNEKLQANIKENCGGLGDEFISLAKTVATNEKELYGSTRYERSQNVSFATSHESDLIAYTTPWKDTDLTKNYKGDHYNVDEVNERLKECDIEGMRQMYQSKCYSCVIIKTLMETFLNACSKAYDVTSEAGLKLLVFGSLIWMAFFVMKNVSSLSNVEPGAMVNTLITFLFKVMVAAILISSGLGVLVKYTINPILTAGADMGMAFMSATSDISGADGLNSLYAVKTPTISDGATSTEIVSSDVMNRVMKFAQDLDKNVSLNLVIGHAITCWSVTGGVWDLYAFKVVNLWLWFCGALIWFVGFMLTLGIGYYLLDISFKLGFSIMALPVVIGLWPFNVTKNKVMAVISIMIKAAGTYVFLALTTTYALVMISVALRDVNTLLKNVEEGNSEWISETFSPTGSYFLIILFTYLYSMKLISSTVSDYVDKFCSDSVFGKATPMHGMLTQMTDMAKQFGMMPVKWAGGKVATAAKEGAKESAVATGKFVRGLFKGKANGDTESEDKNKKASNPATSTGKGLKTAGATAEQTGKGLKTAGKGVEKGGKAAQAGGKGLMTAGKAMSGTFVGAIVGVPMMIAGAATYAAGKGAEVAGKTAQVAGKAMQKGGKMMKKAGAKLEKAGEKMQKVGDKLKFGDSDKSKSSEEKSDDKTDDKAENKDTDKKENNEENSK